MREIKFRALVIKTRLDDLGPNMNFAGVSEYEVMIDVRDISFDNGKIDYITDQDGNEYSFLDNSIKAIYQYTGLKDKNGKEIYEGDIVRSFMQESRGEWKDFERTGIVTYFENYAQFLIKTDDNSLGFDLFQFDDTDDYEVLELEVIGNIY